MVRQKVPNLGARPARLEPLLCVQADAAHLAGSWRTVLQGCPVSWGLGVESTQACGRLAWARLQSPRGRHLAYA